MTKKIFPTVGLIAGAILLTALTGCTTDGSNQQRGYRNRPAMQAQAAVEFQDDYDYYPGYETYYSRNRREYVYRDGRMWVRRPEPRGITVDLLFASPSVRLDFHDSPERHHGNVVRSYPRNWVPPARNHDDKDDRRDDRNDRNSDNKRN